MKNPFLIGESIYLRALVPADFEGNYFGWFNDPRVCQFNSHGRRPNNRQNMEKYYTRVLDDSTLAVFAIVFSDNDCHIGNISLQNINYIDRSAEYAIIMGESGYWGKGIAKEASTLILNYGFYTLNLFRIYCGTSAENIPMNKLAKYMGMTLEGCRRKAIYKNGKYFDINEYGMLVDEFSNREKGDPRESE